MLKVDNRRVVLICLLVITAIVLIRNAWLCDDAYITFRTVSNIVEGYGPVWNVGERVQAYTHPLWMMLMTCCYFVTREIYYTSIVVSVLLSLAAVGHIVFRMARNLWAAVLCVLIVLLCKPFVDFATSGLANPLMYLLLALFYGTFLLRKTDIRTAVWLTLLSSLVALTRLDSVLLVLPGLVWTFSRLRFRQILVAAVVGWSPLVLWLLFSLWYYGVPFPNTAYAKLGAGIARADLIAQGKAYLINLIKWSPFSVAVMFAATLYAIHHRNRRLIAVAAALILYSLYVVWVGGDFMSGRFLASPILLAMIILSQIEWRPRLSKETTVWVALLVLGLLWPSAPIKVGSGYGTGGEEKRWDRGISDERAGWYQGTGLLVQGGDTTLPRHHWVQRGVDARSGPKAVRQSGTGFFGYFAGPEIFVVDNHALSDPLLSRLPTVDPKKWRIGHFNRDIPDGYLASVEHGANLIRDPHLAIYYDTLRIITRGDLWSWSRLGVILRFNLGHHAGLLDEYLGRPTGIEYSKISTPLAWGTLYNDPRCQVLDQGGLLITDINGVLATRYEISVDHNDDYLINFYSDGRLLACDTVKARWIPERGLRIDTLGLRPVVSGADLDSVLVIGVGGDSIYSVGHFRFLP